MVDDSFFIIPGVKWWSQSSRFYRSFFFVGGNVSIKLTEGRNRFVLFISCLFCRRVLLIALCYKTLRFP